MFGRLARRPGLAAGAALALAAAGCWGQVGGNAANQFTNDGETAITPGTVGELAPLWSARGAAHIAWGNRLIGIENGDVRSMSVADGATQWLVPIDLPLGLPIGTNAGPAVVGDEIWAGLTTHAVSPHGGSCGGLNLRLDLATGERLSGTPEATLRAIVPHGGIVATYEETYTYVPQVGCPVATTSPVTVRSAATGEPLWTGAPGGRPVIVGDQLVHASGATLRSYVASGCGAATCEPVWTRQLPSSPLGVAAGDGHIFVLTSPGDGTGVLLAVDRRDGAVSWSASLGAFGSGMSVAGGRVHVVNGLTLATFDGAGCGAPTCAPRWEAALPTSPRGPVISGGGVVYQATNDGTVLAFDAAGCGASVCGPIASVAVAGTPRNMILDAGRLFVTSYANDLATVTAFGLT